MRTITEKTTTKKLQSDRSNSIALYIHYPFCLSRCNYCSFITAVDTDNSAEKYRDALFKEIELRTEQPAWINREIHSIYLGGGTPALIPAEYLSKLLHLIRDKWKTTHDLEVTIETNPTSLEKTDLHELRRIGINRLSIGAQSFDPGELNLLGRRHSPQSIIDTVHQAREAGFTNISLDLLYGIPYQTVKRFRDNVTKAIGLEVNHLSTYALSIEKGTPFSAWITRGDLPYPDADTVSDQYMKLLAIMKEAGFEHYELTNFARPGYRSRHNCTYWERKPYLGLGCAAHSFDGSRRQWNSSVTSTYLQTLIQNRDPIEGSEILNEEEVFEEELYLSLRTSAGILKTELISRIDQSALRELVEGGFLLLQDGRYHVPDIKWLLLDEIILRLLTPIDSIQP